MADCSKLILNFIRDTVLDIAELLSTRFIAWQQVFARVKNIAVMELGSIFDGMKNETGEKEENGAA